MQAPELELYVDYALHVLNRKPQRISVVDSPLETSLMPPDPPTRNAAEL